MYCNNCFEDVPVETTQVFIDEQGNSVYDHNCGKCGKLLRVE